MTSDYVLEATSDRVTIRTPCDCEDPDCAGECCGYGACACTIDITPALDVIARHSTEEVPQ